MGYILGRRVVVTGGAGFLGLPVCQQLKKLGAAAVVAPRSAEYDLRERAESQRLWKESKPDAVVHPSAVVGGIEANRRNPGRFFYENAIMGIQLMEEARLQCVDKFVGVGTICSYPKFTPVSFKEE